MPVAYLHMNLVKFLLYSRRHVDFSLINLNSSTPVALADGFQKPLIGLRESQHDETAEVAFNTRLACYLRSWRITRSTLS